MQPIDTVQLVIGNQIWPNAACIQPPIKGTWVPACPATETSENAAAGAAVTEMMLLRCPSTLPEDAAAGAQGEWAELQPSSASTWGLHQGWVRYSAVAAPSHPISFRRKKGGFQ